MGVPLDSHELSVVQELPNLQLSKCVFFAPVGAAKESGETIPVKMCGLLFTLICWLTLQSANACGQLTSIATAQGLYEHLKAFNVTEVFLDLDETRWKLQRCFFVVFLSQLKVKQWYGRPLAIL